MLRGELLRSDLNLEITFTGIYLFKITSFLYDYFEETKLALRFIFL